MASIHIRAVRQISILLLEVYMTVRLPLARPKQMHYAYLSCVRCLPIVLSFRINANILPLTVWPSECLSMKLLETSHLHLVADDGQFLRVSACDFVEASD